MTIHNSFLDTIGKTPLVRFPKLTAQMALQGDVVGKLEFFNPLSSVKDRIGLAMVEAAERSGHLKKGGTLVEPTSGNTGIALAFVAAAAGVVHRVVWIVVPLVLVVVVAQADPALLSFVIRFDWGVWSPDPHHSGISCCM